MKNKEVLYRAIGGVSEDKIADAYEYTAKKQKNYRLRSVLYGVGIAAIVLSFFVMSFVLLKISGPRTELPADGSAAAETEAETTEPASTDPLRMLIDEDKKNKNGDESVDYELIRQMAALIYSREDTTITQFCLLQQFDTEKYKLFEPTIVRPSFYYDDRYGKNPVYSAGNDEPVWYKPPYVRYQVSGYPDRFGEQKYVTHVDICGLNYVSVCGITVDSSFEEFRDTFSSLGFTVTGGEKAGYLPYSSQRMSIMAQYNGLWIVLEQASHADINQKSYGEDVDYLTYDNDVVPAILRIGVSVENYSPVEQYELP